MYVSAISMRLLRGKSTPASRAMLPYPCRCLWRGFVHCTRTTPARRITLQFLQITFTEARTFISPSSRDATARQIERRQLDDDLVAGRDAQVPHAKRPGHVREHLVAVVEMHPVDGIRHALGHRPAHRDRVTHVALSLQGKLKIYGPPAVTA